MEFTRFLGILIMHAQTVCTRLSSPPPPRAWVQGYVKVVTTVANYVLNELDN